MRIEKYGAGGEKLCHAQMDVFVECRTGARSPSA
jgi:hypothetical protein